MESFSPNIFVCDMKATVAFYELLGFKTTMSVPEESDNLIWAMMVNGNVTMMFQTYESLADELPEISRQDGGSLLLYINLKDIHGFYEKVKDKVTVLKGLETTF